jgi:3-hydroxyisobutyrate dehydrogenase
VTDLQSNNLQSHKLGWIGTGRMGFNLAARLIDAGCDVAIYNRTRSKAEPLVHRGGKLVESPRELADRDIVFSMVAGDDDFRAVTTGEEGVLAQAGAAPQILIDSTTISAGVSAEVRTAAEAVGTSLLAAPVSGNPNVVRAGKLTLVVSGPEEAWEVAQPYLQVLGSGATYVGEGDAARLAKICHNLMLGVVAQSMAEITVLAEKGGLKRSDFLEFLNKSVMGSPFTRYKTPAFVNLDYLHTCAIAQGFRPGTEGGARAGCPDAGVGSGA